MIEPRVNYPSDLALDLGPCVVGETLCRLLLWSEAEWARLSVEGRPALVEHVPGLGWVGAGLTQPG